MTTPRASAETCALAVSVLAMLVIALASCAEDVHANVRPFGAASDVLMPVSLIRVPPPPLSEETFPCTDCHDPELPVKTTPRKLEMLHEEIVLHHAEESRWCLDCHDTADRDMLHLANGELVPFEESHRLCGQCHGEKYRDWRAGVHGRRTGSWNGEKEYLLCVHCHDSHAPKFKPLAPLAAPTPPEVTR
jgi:hypothetical protein